MLEGPESDFLKSNYNDISTYDYSISSIPLIDNVINDYSVILLGEKHGVKRNKEIENYMLKYLNTNYNGFNYSLRETGLVNSHYINILFMNIIKIKLKKIKL